MSQINKEGNYTLTSFDKVRIVMVNTTEPGNIGAAARAMKNMMLSELYLVAPSNFPSAVATAREHRYHYAGYAGWVVLGV